MDREIEERLNSAESRIDAAAKEIVEVFIYFSGKDTNLRRGEVLKLKIAKVIRESLYGGKPPGVAGPKREIDTRTGEERAI